MARHVFGVILLVAATLLVLQWIGIRRRVRRTRHAARTPRRAIRVVTRRLRDETRSVVDISGTAVGPATLTAPISGRRCLAWQLRLSQEQDDPERNWFKQLWHAGAAGELVLAYDEVLSPEVGLTGPGQLTIPAGRVRMDLKESAGLRSSPYEAPAGDPDQLARLGVPADVIEAVARAPVRCELIESILPAGAFVHLQQQVDLPHEPLPDPDLDLTYHALSHESGSAVASDIVSTVAILGATVLCGFGYALLR
jgi:hypothetical protein